MGEQFDMFPMSPSGHQRKLKTEGEQLRDQGMKQALDHANQKSSNWGEIAYKFLVSYAFKHKEFATEDVRLASKGHVPPPPDSRAWGSVITKAAKSKLIKKKGYGNAKEKSSHCGIVTIWEVI